MYKSFLVLIFTLCFSTLFSQLNSLQKSALIEAIEKVINDDWFVVETQKGFDVFFCRSCQKAFRKELDSLGSFFAKERYKFFDLTLVDSVCYYPTVSNPPYKRPDSDSLFHLDMIRYYEKNNRVVFKIEFEEKWKKSRYDSIFRNNEILKAEILKQPIYKTSNRIFSDYRFLLPDARFKDRTNMYSFYFQKLPYSSSFLNQSIFIYSDKPYFFCDAMYVDLEDQFFYKKSVNRLENERKKALKIIALVLGIEDFEILD